MSHPDAQKTLVEEAKHALAYATVCLGIGGKDILAAKLEEDGKALYGKEHFIEAMKAADAKAGQLAEDVSRGGFD